MYRTLIGALLAATAIVAPLSQAQGQAGAEAQEDERNFSIPSQELGRSLRDVAAGSGRGVIAPSALVAGRRAPALNGRYSAEEAVRRLLAGSGLGVRRVGDSLVIVAQGGGESPAEVASAADASPAQGASIVVTGTRIRGGAASSPVIVTTRRQLEEAGVADLAGFTRLLPQNFTGGQNPGIAGGGTQGGQNNINNSATLNLRGLGPDATLTLINGHRVAYDALNQGVDVSAIPLAAIERIDVITDGASALYGSDAVAGVANIILRRDFDGLETRVRFGGSTEGGNDQRQFSAVGGGRWSSGGFMATFDHLRTTPITAGQRDYTSGLDPSATLISGQSQSSIVFAGHQRLFGGLSLELDSQFSSRRSSKSTPFFATSDVFTNGLFNRPEVDSFAFTPTLRAALPAGWEARASLTRATSRTDIFSRRFLGGVETPSRLIYENRMASYEGTAEGPLFSLPGGSARLAIGGGLRSVLLDVNVSQLAGGVPRVTRDVTERRNIQFAYGELSLPLIGPANEVPLVEQLRLSAALRYERYEGIDEVATPKLGLVYQPHEDVTFRLAWGQSFKVPTLNQVNQLRVGTLIPGSIFTPQPSPPLPAGATVLFLSGGNPDLAAERATTWAAGVELRPQFLRGLRVEATWFRIDYRGRVSSPFSGTLAALANPAFSDFVIRSPTSAQVAELIASLPQGLVNQTGQPFDSARVAAILDGTLQNIARERAWGVDFAVDYRIDLGDDHRIDLVGQASYLDSERQISAGQPVLQRAGIIFNPPNWRWRFGGSWTARSFGASLFINHIDGTTDDRFAVVERIGGFTTIDASLRFRSAARRGPLRGVELSLSALNLLNEEPSAVRDADPAAPPFDSINQSPVGRFLSLSITKRW